MFNLLQRLMLIGAIITLILAVQPECELFQPSTFHRTQIERPMLLNVTRNSINERSESSVRYFIPLQNIAANSVEASEFPTRSNAEGAANSPNSRQRAVCFAVGFGEYSLSESGPEDYSSVKETLERNGYQAQPIALAENPTIPSNCAIIVSAGPRYDYPLPVVNALKRFVEQGGRALFMLGPPLDAGSTRIAANQALTDMIADWGVTLHQDQVLDVSGVGSSHELGPEVAFATEYSAHPIVSYMKHSTTVLAIVRSLDTQPMGSANAETIVWTTGNSFSTTELSGKERKIDLSKGVHKPYAVAAAGTYRTSREGRQGRFVVIGSSDWVANYILRFAANRDLFLNMVNWLSAEQGPALQRLSLSQVQQLVSVGTPDGVIAQEVRERGVSIAPTGEVLEDLVRHGAGPRTVSALRGDAELSGREAPSGMRTLKPQGFVNDYAGVLDTGGRRQLEEYCKALERETGAQLAIVTLSNLEGSPIEQVALDLFRNWGIGRKEVDDGVMLLLAVQDRKSRLQIGRGLTQVITDAQAADILSSMSSELRAGRYTEALLRAATSVHNLILERGPMRSLAPP
jgi:hypothetical protein